MIWEDIIIIIIIIIIIMIYLFPISRYFIMFSPYTPTYIYQSISY